MQQGWDAVIREPVTASPIPTGFSCKTSKPSEITVHATRTIKDGLEPICRWKKGAAGKQDFKTGTMTEKTIEEAAKTFGGTFCVNCIPLLRASLALEVNQFFGYAG